MAPYVKIVHKSAKSKVIKIISKKYLKLRKQFLIEYLDELWVEYIIRVYELGKNCFRYVILESAHHPKAHCIFL